jgi:hypothetical protein
MTRLDFLAKIFASLEHSEEDVKTWAEANMTPALYEEFSQELSDEDGEALLEELRADPLGVRDAFVQAFFAGRQPKFR